MVLSYRMKISMLEMTMVSLGKAVYFYSTVYTCLRQAFRNDLTVD